MVCLEYLLLGPKVTKKVVRFMGFLCCVSLAQVLRRAQLGLKAGNGEEEDGEEGEKSGKGRGKGRGRGRGRGRAKSKAKAKAGSKAAAKSKGKDRSKKKTEEEMDSDEEENGELSGEEGDDEEEQEHQEEHESDQKTDEIEPVEETSKTETEKKQESKISKLKSSAALDVAMPEAEKKDEAEPVTKKRKPAPEHQDETKPKAKRPSKETGVGKRKAAATKTEKTAGKEAEKADGKLEKEPEKGDEGKKRGVGQAATFARRVEPKGEFSKAKWQALRNCFHRVIRPKVTAYSTHEDFGKSVDWGWSGLCMCNSFCKKYLCVRL